MNGSKAAKAARAKRKADPRARHVRLYHDVIEHPAYRSLSCVARSLLVEIKNLYTGSNNGRIFLSVRDAAARLGTGPRQANEAFHDLVNRGFIRIQAEGSFIQKMRIATSWTLTELANDATGQPATNDYLRWVPDPEDSDQLSVSKKKQNTVSPEDTVGVPRGYREASLSESFPVHGVPRGYRQADSDPSTVSPEDTHIVYQGGALLCAPGATQAQPGCPWDPDASSGGLADAAASSAETIDDAASAAGAIWPAQGAGADGDLDQALGASRGIPIDTSGDPAGGERAVMWPDGGEPPAGIGANLRRWRKSRPWTLTKLAEASGVPATTIGRVERGDRRLSADDYMKLVGALAVDELTIQNTRKPLEAAAARARSHAGALNGTVALVTPKLAKRPERRPTTKASLRRKSVPWPAAERRQAKLTQARLAKLAGVSRGVLAALEGGARSPRQDMRERPDDDPLLASARLRAIPRREP